jgi:hypothetical protein
MVARTVPPRRAAGLVGQSPWTARDAPSRNRTTDPINQARAVFASGAFSSR